MIEIEFDVCEYKQFANEMLIRGISDHETAEQLIREARMGGIRKAIVSIWMLLCKS